MMEYHVGILRQKIYFMVNLIKINTLAALNRAANSMTAMKYVIEGLIRLCLDSPWFY